MRCLIALFLTVFALSGCEQKTPADQASSPTTHGDSRDLTDFSAHWLAPDVILIHKVAKASSIRLYYSLDASIGLADDKVELNGNPSFALLELKADPKFASSFRGFAENYTVVHPEIKINQGAMRLIAKGQIVIVQQNEAGKVLKASQVQTARLLDYLYTSRDNDADEIDDYGATVHEEGVQFKLWAPTARSVGVLLFDAQKRPLPNPRLTMSLDANTGVWSVLGDRSLAGAYYQYQINLYHPESNKIETLVTTDPYALSLSTNSVYAQVVDLDSPDSKPKGWDEQNIVSLPRYEDAVLYELHIRDFSARDTLKNEAARGRYAAFLETDSHGIRHLRALRAAGLTHVHLLPTFDIATVNEDPSMTLYPEDTLEKVCRIAVEAPLCKGKYDPQQRLHDLLLSLPTASAEAQAIVSSLRGYDAYNWGYDPFHYSVPEGSYAVNPEGLARIVEFRAMVQALHGMGFRVVMDVVYNHTFIAGLNSKSVLDKIVPNYYHRLDQATGRIEQSTCCDNTATENAMMAKLMTDSLLVWTRHYKIDGFRFDLMGHQPKNAMLAAYDKVRAIDPDNYFYGEGWNFGEVANNRYFVQASQLELGGTEIGTFSDRLRDAVRGGSFNASGDQLRAAQGYGNGLYTQPNEIQPDDGNRALYLQSADQIRVGLAGNLAHFPLQNSAGEQVTGKDIPYGDGPTGYALDPADTVTYVSKHDNQTLWDNHQYRIRFDASTEERVRLHNLSLAFPLLSQGVPFIHMGSELLRSKSFLRDSYDYGDWFNAVDFSMQDNNYNVGLPPQEKDEANWPLIRKLLEKNAGRDQVKAEHIQFANAVFMEFLQIRSSSPLFRLPSAEEIIARVHFHNTGPTQIPGLIAMELRDEAPLGDLDPQYRGLMILFNNSRDALSLPHPAADYRLHPAQAKGIDGVIKQSAKASAEGFTVPAMSVAVFVKAQ